MLDTAGLLVHVVVAHLRARMLCRVVLLVGADELTVLVLLHSVLDVLARVTLMVDALRHSRRRCGSRDLLLGRPIVASQSGRHEWVKGLLLLGAHLLLRVAGHSGLQMLQVLWVKHLSLLLWSHLLLLGLRLLRL